MNSGENRYYRRSRISDKQFRSLIHAFALDLTANDAAELTGLSVRSVNDIYLKIRRRLAEHCESQSPFQGEVEIDESYFGPKRIRGKRGRGAGGKTIVFGVLKRGDCVYTEIVPDARKTTLQKAIRGRVSLNTIIHSDGWPPGKAMMAWSMSALPNTCTLTMEPTSLPINARTSMALRASGATPSTASPDSTAS